MLERNPFLTDEQLAKALEVSIQTIRLDRLRMNIPEVRERTRQMAENAQTKLKAIDKKDIVGDLIDLELNKIGISMLKITPEMVLEKTGVARGYYMFAMANTLALAVVDADAALTGVGNVKYKVPVYAGATLVAKAEVIRLSMINMLSGSKFATITKKCFVLNSLLYHCPTKGSRNSENCG